MGIPVKSVLGSVLLGLAVCSLKCEIKFAVADFCVAGKSLAINCLIWLFKINDMFFICHCTFARLFYIKTFPVYFHFLHALLSVFKTANNVETFISIMQISANVMKAEQED